jgi:hypothetical protein
MNAKVRLAKLERMAKGVECHTCGPIILVDFDEEEPAEIPRCACEREGNIRVILPRAAAGGRARDRTVNHRQRLERLETGAERHTCGPIVIVEFRRTGRRRITFMRFFAPAQGLSK